MIIQFYDEEDSLISEITVGFEDYVKGAQLGHSMMREGKVPGADDFQIVFEEMELSMDENK